MVSTTLWEYTNDRKFACMIEVSPTATQSGAIRWFYTFRTHGLVDKSFTSKVSFELFANDDHAVEEAMRIKRRFLDDYNNDLVYESSSGEAPREEFTVSCLWDMLNNPNEPGVVISAFPLRYLATLDAGTIVLQARNGDGSLGAPWYVGAKQTAEAARTDKGLMIDDQRGFPMFWQYESLTDIASNLEATDCF